METLTLKELSNAAIMENAPVFYTSSLEWVGENMY